jgi:IclR family transcriptional regulator, KDG regulon repressor
MENVSETVNKALDILEIFLSRDGDLSLAELSEISGLNKTTTYRMVSTLLQRRYVHQRNKNGKYYLGLKSLDFAFAIRRNIRFIDPSYLYLSKLSKSKNISTYVSIMDDDSSLVVEEVAVVETMRINSPVGTRMPLYATACGKILLSALSREERKAYYTRLHPFNAFTSHTIIDSGKLDKEVEKVKMEGLALADEEYKMGLLSFAAPIFNSTNRIIAAAGVVVPVAQFDEDGVKNLKIGLKSCAAEISQVIGRTG